MEEVKNVENEIQIAKHEKKVKCKIHESRKIQNTKKEIRNVKRNFKCWELIKKV